MGIKCEYDYCIYNEKGIICTFNKIQINCIGMCDNCITLQLPDDKLEEYKQSQLREIANLNLK